MSQLCGTAKHIVGHGRNKDAVAAVVTKQVHWWPVFGTTMNPLPRTVDLLTQRNRNHLQLIFTQPRHKSVDAWQPIIHQKTIVLPNAQLSLTKFCIVRIKVVLKTIFFFRPLFGVAGIKEHSKGNHTILIWDMMINIIETVSKSVAGPILSVWGQVIFFFLF